MKLGKFTLIIFTFILIIASCTPDDDGVNVTPPRDRYEVYAEDLLEIETFLETHFYNYDDFDFTTPYDNPANDDFQIVFLEIPSGNPDNKISLKDSPELKFKMVEDPNEDGLFYKLYYLEVREGLGEVVHGIDQVFVTYEGSTTGATVFDDAINPINFELTNVLNGGVVTGFKETLIEFKTATNYTDNGDGTETYHNHGIGAAFLPSGLAYFNQPLENVDSYTPLIFKFSLFDRALLDHDNDGIPSFLEDLDGDLNVYDDDTNNDSAPNFFDGDDDGDGINTIDEIELKSYPDTTGMNGFATKTDARDYFTTIGGEEIFRGVDVNNDGTFTLNTFITTDSNGNGSPDYLDNTYPVQ